MSEDEWERPENFSLYQEDIQYRQVRFPMPEWVGRKEYNALLQIQCDMTNRNYEHAFAGILSLFNKVRESAPGAEASEKALTEGTLPHNWRELIKIIMESSVPDGKETFNLTEAVDWSWLWNTFEKFFDKQGIRERPYDGPVRAVRDNPQA